MAGWRSRQRATDADEATRWCRVARSLAGSSLLLALLAGACVACRGGPTTAEGSALGPSASVARSAAPGRAGSSGQLAPLPAPNRHSSVALEDLIARRRSVREFAPQPLGATDLSQLAWATQGLAADGTHRSVPSAGALYPLELRLVCQDGLFHYEPQGHAMALLAVGDLRAALSDAALGQSAVAAAPCTFALSGVVERTARKYGDRARRFIAMEAGHAAQNLLLQAEAMGLVGVPIGGFDERRVGEVLGLAEGEEALYLVPVGHRAR